MSEDLASTMSFLLDEIKKKIAETKFYSEKKAEELSKNLEEVVLSFDDNLAKAECNTKKVLDFANEISDRCFLNTNNQKDLLNRLKELDSLSVNLKELQKNLVSSNSEYKNSLEENENTIILIDKKLQDSKREFNELKDSYCLTHNKLKDSLFGILKSQDEIFEKTRELSTSLLDMKKEFFEISSSFSVVKESVSKFLSKISDLTRVIENNKKMFLSDNVKLKESLSTKAESTDIEDLKKALKEATFEADKKFELCMDTIKMRLDPDWKDHVEMKLSRIEKKLNAKSNI